MQITTAENKRDDIIKLLASLNLPVDDVPLAMDNFFVAFTDDGTLAGTAGLEVYHNFGLLRSVGVIASEQGKGIAEELLRNIEQLAIDNQLKAIYLLTETASAYFEKRGYRVITRDNVPDEIKASSEFSHVCPVSAMVMKKEL